MKQQLHHRGYLTGIRTLLLLCIGLTSAVWTGQAQTPMFFNGNTGASSNAFPLNSGTSNKVQWIYAPGTFNSNGSTGTPAFAGNITKVWFRLSATTATYANFTISLGQNVGAIANYGTTTASGVAFNTGLTTCFYQASYPLTTVAGWNGFTLQTPFPYNPALALIIELKVSSTVGASSLQLNTTGSMQRLYAGYAATTGTINTGLVNAGIDVIVSTPCVAPPTPGTVTVSPSTPFCLGGSASLTLTGNSSGSGQTYQWESSSVSGGPYTDIAGATTTATTVSPSATSYYRCKVTCSGNTVPTPDATVSVNPPFPGGNYTINSALPTGGTNFQSFSAAVAAMSCGISSSIVFDVVPGSGPYNEQISLPASIGSNATKTVTFNGNGNTIQFASADAANKHVIRLDGADYVTFDNLNIIGSGGTYGWGIHLMNGADYNTFSLCNVNVSITDATAYNHVALVVANSTSSPITAGNGGNYNTFIDDNLEGGYYCAVLYGNAIGTENLSNNLTNVSFKNFYGYGCYMAYQKNPVISGCNFSRPNRTTSTTTASAFLTTGVIGALVENNRIHNYFDAFTTSTSTMYGIYVAGDGSSTEPNRLVNNVIYNINHNGALYGIYNTGADYCKVYHNTIALDQTTAAATGVTYGIYQTTAVLGMEVRNNIVTISRGGSGAKVGLYYNTTTSAITSNNNDVFLTANGTGTINYGNSGGTNFANLAAWQAANGGVYDANSAGVNPAYTSPGTADFTPTSPIVNNMGGNIGVPFDILGNPRTLNAPDPGAYEYDLVGLDAGIAWVSPVSPVSAGNQTITVSITNNLSNTVNSVELAYTDGGTPVTETFTGLGLTSANSVNLSFTVPYNMVSNTSLKAYIISVNGGVDDIQADDTTSVQNLCISLAGNYTIDAGSAASATNFQNFTALANALNCGGVSGPVTVNVVAGSGPYNEQVTFNQAIGSSAVNTITINGNGNTLNFTPTTEYFTLRLNGADYFNFNNLNVTGTGANVITTILTNNANYNNFTACTFTVPSSNTATSNSAVAFTSSTTTATSGASNGNNNVFDGCTMSGGYYCVSVYGASGATNQGNQFLNCTITEYYVYGFYHIYGNGTLVQGCTLERPTRASVSTGYGIVITTGSSNCLVQNNRVRKLFGGIPTSTSTCYLLYCTAAASAGNENKFINNLASNIESNGAIYGLYFSGASYIQAYHNTISLDHTASTGTGVTYGLYSSTATGTDYRDNIISITRGGTGTKYCAYYATLLPTNTNYNNHYMNAAAGTNYFAYDGVSATSYATLAAWQSAHPTLDMQTVSIDPIYTDPSLQNYSPSNFALDNLGTNAGIAADIMGNPRSATTPDIGAYEFTVAPTDAGVYTVTSPGTGGCYTNNESVIVTIKNYGFNPIDFSNNPMTINALISGPANSTATGSPSGILAPGATMSVTLSPGVDMTLPGSYSITATSITTGDGNALNDNLPAPATRTVGIVPGTVTASLSDLCNSGTPTLTLAGNYGGAIQWQESIVGATGPWTNVGTGAQTYVPGVVSQDTWYQAVLSCNSYTANSNVHAVSVASPTVVSTTPGSHCGYGQVTLGATGSAGTSLNWYASATSTTPIGSGSSFTTPNIANSTTYYVAANEGGVGAPMSLLTTSAAGNGSTGVLFDMNVLNTVRIDSFSDYVPAGTSCAIFYRAGTGYGGNQSSNVGWIPLGSANAGTQVGGLSVIPVFVNLTLTPGLYSFAILTATTNSYTNGTAVGNIYVSDANVQIKEGYGGGGTPPNTIAFVNSPRVWNGRLYYSTLGCESPKSAVLATISTPPAMTVNAADPTLCPGGSTTVSVSSPNDPNYTYTWSSDPAGFTATGPGPHTVSPTVTTKYYVNAIDNTSGSFAGCAAFDSVTVITAPALLPGTVSASQTTFCLSGTPTLTLSGSAGGAIQWQESNSATGPWTNVGTGGTTYTPSSALTQTMYYQVAVSCQSTTLYSNVLTITVHNPVLLGTTGGTICGTNGTTVLNAATASGSSALWYANPTGGLPLQLGNNYTTPNISSTTTYYASAVIGTGGTALAAMPAQSTTFTGNVRGYWFTAPVGFAITGVNVPLTGTTQSIAIVRFNGGIPPPTYSATTNAFTTLFLTQNNTNTGLIPCNVVVAPGDVIGIIGQRGTVTSYGPTTNPSNITIGGFSVPCTRMGMQFPLTTTAPQDLWQEVTATSSIGRIEFEYTTGCEGATRTPVVATVEPVPAITANPASTSVCTGASVTLSGSGAGTGGTYNWTGGITDNTPFVASSSATYTVTGTTANGCSATATASVVVAPCNTTLNLTCFIEGYWDGVSQMVPALANQGETTTTGACDSIDVELHSDTFPYGVDATTRAVLQQNGTATCIFPPVTGNKYIAVKHRSGLQTWSANPVAMGTTASYDFSTADTQAFGNNMIQVSTSPVVWAFFSGDVITDENMDLLDLGAVETDISNFGFGYLATDLNGDGNVDLLDSPMLEVNISNFIYSNHP